MKRTPAALQTGAAPAPAVGGSPHFVFGRRERRRDPKLAAGDRALLPPGPGPRGGRGFRAVRERFRSRELLRVAEPVAAVARRRRRFLLEVGVAREPLVEAADEQRGFLERQEPPPQRLLARLAHTLHQVLFLVLHVAQHLGDRVPLDDVGDAILAAL